VTHKYKGLFQSWEIGVATKIVREFIGNWKFLSTQDEEDLLQECLTHWFYNREKFDASKGVYATEFMARIVRNKLMDLVREQNADKRKVAHNSDSLNQPLSNDEESFSLLDVLASDSDFRIQAELKISIEQTYSQLTETQQELYRCLSEGKSSLQELSESLGIGRSTIYREIDRIRKVFEQEGLKDFWE
jgi:RNA polymerase sigma factor (sigma-70 family)